MAFGSGRDRQFVTARMGWQAPAVLACVALGTAALAAARPEHAALDKRIQEAARLPGEPSIFESMGVTRGEIPLRSVESRDPLDGPRRRLVMLGGLDGNDRSVDATLGALHWWKTQAPAALKAGWTVIVVPCGNPEGWVQLKPTNDYFGKPTVNYPPKDSFFNEAKFIENRYLWRWLAFQAPDLVVEVHGGNRLQWSAPPPYAALGQSLGAKALVAPDSLPMALSKDNSELGAVPALVADARATDGPALLQAALTAAANLQRSPLRQSLIRRMQREPLAVAERLARRYPEKAQISYIPSTAWSGALRVAQLRGDVALGNRVKEQVAQWTTGATPSLDEKPDPVKLGGHVVFAELALAAGDAADAEPARKLALAAAERYRPEAADGIARYTGRACEDLYMSAGLLGRAAKLSGDVTYLDLLARTMTQISGKLQNEDGLYQHATDSPHRWGRGNGFASLGLMEALTWLPADHPLRAALLARFRKQMAALKPHQTPEGTWRQIIDRPESYREVTATAMNLAAMARGVRLGWLDGSYRAVVDRAWSGLSARIADDGGLTDVCAGTGPGPTLTYYYERPAVSGGDDRGGAMALLAALEVHELRAGKP